MTDRLWLYVHFPHLALESRFGPSEADALPQLLIDRGGREVLQCNAAASRCHVRPGMSPSTAYCLLEEVQVAPIDEEQTGQQLSRLALSLYAGCADIRLCSPDGLLLNAAPMLTLFGGLDAWLGRVERRLRHLGFRYQLALGHTPLAARLLARYHPRHCHPERATIKAALDELPLEHLDLPERHAEKLAAMGLNRHQQLRQLPLSELGYRFGASLVKHLQALQSPHPLGQAFEPPRQFHERLELPFEAELATSLIFPARRLLQHLEAYLQVQRLTAAQLTWRLEHRELPETLVKVQAVQGTRRVEDWLTLTSLALERQPLPAPVTALRLHLQQSQPETRLDGDLLGTAYPEADAERLLSLLLSRLGADKVTQPWAGPDPRPWYASQPRALTQGVAETPVEYRSRQHPTLLLDTPKPIRLGDYQLLSGPERIVTGQWLQQPAFRRDYVRAWQHRTEQLHWLARHDDGAWYLEGVFA
ncbi:MAG: DNA polymerase Y family protein [Saccharospirillum sp.]|nr:DNA polymerase Y family protein [Saccharospirillum sp.]